MGIKTVACIVPETMTAIWETLTLLHMAVPSVDDFIRISKEFKTKWNFPHCIGAIDGRHVPIKKPNNSGSLYFNYKGYYSIVLQAAVDANYRYICIQDVGGYGSQHDAATFRASQLYRALMLKKLNLPNASRIENSDLCMPYFLIGDGAYPLSNILMKPYRGINLSHQQKIFNNSLSKARVVVENAFGQSSQKWRILSTNIEKSPEIINLIIKCTCLLHNIIINLESESHVHNNIVEQPIDDTIDNDDVQMIAVTELEKANQLLASLEQERLDQTVEHLAPTAAITSKIHTKGLSLTQIYTKLVETVNGLTVQKEGNDNQKPQMDGLFGKN
ncbi:uncharacterized protein [Fopius arisanus]|uniref:DDE Tnp4 domain-containing protein n=1 Tax=Fopius arisanus TaxID=64838 RepID=A0A9R1TQK7_9HYME|nr:PREDICTED: uncharacterized protein LOC105272988 [Fopius arisanus]